MRIAYLCGDRGVLLDGNTGSSVHVRELVRALAARGEEVSYLGPVSSTRAARRALGCPVIDVASDRVLAELQLRMSKSLRAAGESVVRASETHDLLINLKLAEELARQRHIDLLYERFSLWSIAGVRFAQRRGVPYLVEVNAPLATQQEEYRELAMTDIAKAIEAYVLEHASLVLVTSEELRQYAHERGVSRRRVRVVPCGVSGEILAAGRTRRTHAKGEFVVGFLGSLKPWHGVEILLQAFEQLRAKNAAYRLLIVGDGPMMPELRRACARPELREVVTLTGDVPHGEIGGFLEQMDVGVAPYPALPSFYFSPLKVWEYAGAGVPIVASASGELPVLFPHRSAALLHPPGKVGKIVKHIERLRLDPTLGPRLARRARATARAHTWDRIAARIVSLSSRLIAKADRGSMGSPRR